MSSMTGMSSFENKEGLVSVLLATLGGRSVRPPVWLTRMTKDCGELGCMRASSLVQVIQSAGLEIVEKLLTRGSPA
jgi:hypothetical protein